MTRHAHNLATVALKALGIAALLLFAAAVVLVVPAVGAMRSLYDNATAGKADIDRAKDAADALDLVAASEALTDAQLRFAAAQDDLMRLGPMSKLPYVRKEVASVSAALSGAHEAAYALHEAIGVAGDLLSVAKSGAGAVGLVPEIEKEQRPVGELTRDERREMLKRMIEAPERLEDARAALDRAIASFDRIEPSPITDGLLAALAPQKGRLVKLRDLLSYDLSFLSKVPILLGYPAPRTYLFLLLNNTELRPGGGFVGTYGIIKIADGELQTFYTDDVYALDGPAEAYLKEAPPEALKRYLRVPHLFMRDANWSPDFVESAKAVERFYHLEKGREKTIDGVIGITPTFISKLLEITGPVTVGSSRFDAANITDELEYQVEKGFYENGTPYFQRKAIVGQFGEVLIGKLLKTPVAQLPGLASAAQAAIQERHVMTWFKEPTLQSFADARDWSGRFAPYDGDGLAIIDANMAALKTDRVMDRRISYGIRPDGDGYVARAAITYKNNGRFDWRTTRYRTYTRFYVPHGSVFLKGEGMMVDDKLYDPRRRTGTIDVSEDLGRTVFGGFISVEPGETRTLAVEYRLPAGTAAAVAREEYRLDVRKQLGTVAHGLTLDLDFGKTVARATPAEARQEWGDARYRMSTDLRTDRKFSIGFPK